MMEVQTGPQAPEFQEETLSKHEFLIMAFLENYKTF